MGEEEGAKLNWLSDRDTQFRKVVQRMVLNHSREVKASACSKVLITGAYLIIDPANEGIVLSTDA